MITVTLVCEGPDEHALSARVSDGGSETVHEVTVKQVDFARLARKNEDVSTFVCRCFEFLLERESKESIMRRFDVMVIARYFPEFERVIAGSQ